MKRQLRQRKTNARIPQNTLSVSDEDKSRHGRDETPETKAQVTRTEWEAIGIKYNRANALADNERRISPQKKCSERGKKRMKAGKYLKQSQAGRVECFTELHMMGPEEN